MMLRCRICGNGYEPSDYTDESEAAEDCCPDCLYDESIFSVEDDEAEMEELYEEEDDLYDDEDNYLDASYDDIDVSDEEFEEDLED